MTFRVDEQLDRQRSPFHSSSHMLIAKHLTGDMLVARSALDLMHGTVDILVLRTLAWEPMHGYAISQFVRARTDGAIAIESAALYQALHRLERRKFVRAWWGVSETNRRARFYELTAAGRRQLRDQSAELKAYVGAMLAVLDGR